MTEFLVTSSLEPLKKGEQFEKELPRHVTVLQWFSVPYEQAFINSLQNLAARTEPFEITAGEEALFGPNNDVPVRVLRRIGRLAAIHSDILAIVARQAGEVRNPQWAGDNYHPHITYVDGCALEENETAVLDNLELIRREEGEKLKTVVSALKMTGDRR